VAQSELPLTVSIHLNMPGLLMACSGDVALHALTDAILGALCLPDIGQLFPDTDPKWKGANSDTFIKEAVRHSTSTSSSVLTQMAAVLTYVPHAVVHMRQ